MHVDCARYVLYMEVRGLACLSCEDVHGCAPAARCLRIEVGGNINEAAVVLVQALYLVSLAKVGISSDNPILFAPLQLQSLVTESVML